MGTIQHDAVLVETGDANLKAIKKFRKKLPKELGDILQGPYWGSNGSRFYVWFPDGSKEGWEQSNLANEWRWKFVELVLALEYTEVVSVGWGELVDCWAERKDSHG